MVGILPLLTRCVFLVSPAFLPTPIFPTNCKHQTHLLLPKTTNHITSGTLFTLTYHANSGSLLLTKTSKHKIKHEKYSWFFQKFFFFGKISFYFQNNSSCTQLILIYIQKTFILMVSNDDIFFYIQDLAMLFLPTQLSPNPYYGHASIYFFIFPL